MWRDPVQTHRRRYCGLFGGGSGEDESFGLQDITLYTSFEHVKSMIGSVLCVHVLCVCAWVCICVCTCLYACLHVYMHVHAHVYMCMCVCICVERVRLELYSRILRVLNHIDIYVSSRNPMFYWLTKDRLLKLV